MLQRTLLSVQFRVDDVIRSKGRPNNDGLKTIKHRGLDRRFLKTAFFMYKGTLANGLYRLVVSKVESSPSL